MVEHTIRWKRAIPQQKGGAFREEGGWVSRPKPFTVYPEKRAYYQLSPAHGAFWVGDFNCFLTFGFWEGYDLVNSDPVFDEVLPDTNGLSAREFIIPS